jgi:hypothetical protein
MQRRTRLQRLETHALGAIAAPIESSQRASSPGIAAQGYGEAEEDTSADCDIAVREMRSYGL